MVEPSLAERFRCTHCQAVYATDAAVHYAFDKAFCSTYCRYTWLREWEEANPSATSPARPSSFASRLFAWIRERDSDAS